MFRVSGGLLFWVGEAWCLRSFSRADVIVPWFEIRFDLHDTCIVGLSNAGILILIRVL